jgi:hypothetical protein
MKTLAVLLLLCTPAVAQEDNGWHFLSQSYGGTISLVKGLTKQECEFMKNRALGRPATDEEKAAAKLLSDRRNEVYKKWRLEHPECENSMGATFSLACVRPFTETYLSTTSSGDIRTAECFR